MTASDRADLMVVGASFAGVACAIEAARAGLRVILVERKTDVGEKLHTTGIVVKEAADDLGRLGNFPPELIRPDRRTAISNQAPAAQSVRRLRAPCCSMLCSQPARCLLPHASFISIGAGYCRHQHGRTCCTDSARFKTH